ncbi:MAG: hypothetical protein HQK50_09300, partial [Oligoflexia bacterium]|nr:hypothetical protein [Oligoflexia bacterium]
YRVVGENAVNTLFRYGMLVINEDLEHPEYTDSEKLADELLSFSREKKKSNDDLVDCLRYAVSAASNFINWSAIESIELDQMPVIIEEAEIKKQDDASGTTRDRAWKNYLGEREQRNRKRTDSLWQMNRDWEIYFGMRDEY